MPLLSPAEAASSAAKPSPTPKSQLFARIRFIATAVFSAYLIMNAILAVVLPLTPGWPTYGVTALTVPPMVLLMIFVVIPYSRRPLEQRRAKVEQGAGNVYYLRRR